MLTGSRPAFWPTPLELSQALARERDIRIGFEVAPSGRIHPGILRTIAYATAIKNSVGELGSRAELVIRINDLAAVKNSFKGTSSFGRPPLCDGTSYPVIRLLKDIAFCEENFPVKVDSVVLASEVYADRSFRKILFDAYQKIDQVVAILNSSKSTEATYFWPRCEFCSRLYATRLGPHATSASGIYHCNHCDHSSAFDLYSSSGLVTFKLEAALMWQYLGLSVDVHGQDHLDAFNAASRISHALYAKSPMHGRVNLTFNASGQKVSKSTKNYVPVAEYDTSKVAELTRLIDAIPWRRPLRLSDELSA